MNEHISLEELSRFVWIRQVTPETVQRSLRINSHVMACADCARRLEQMQITHDSVQKSRQVSQRARRAMAGMRLMELDKELQNVAEGLEKDENQD